jgi:hypothetical protein
VTDWFGSGCGVERPVFKDDVLNSFARSPLGNFLGAH